MNLQDKLEEIKQNGNYQICLFYGEEIGADDLDIPQDERRVIVIAHPHGYLGEVRTLWKGKLLSFLNFDFKYNIPKIVPNPPSNNEVEESGYYVWGAGKSAYDYIRERGGEGK